MKRWAIGILSVSTLAGLGWFGFSWFGHGSGSETPPPNFAEVVNAEAAAMMDNHRGGNNTLREDPARANSAWNGQNSPDSAAGQRTTNDPFQRVRQTSGTNNYDYDNAARTGVDSQGRYAGEPRRLPADSTAAPLAQDSTGRERGAGADEIPSSSEAGLNNSPAAANDVPSDPRRAVAQSPSELRYSEEGARQATALGTQNGGAPADTIDNGNYYGQNQAASSSRQNGAAAPMNAVGQGYGNATSNAGPERAASSPTEVGRESQVNNPFAHSQGVPAAGNSNLQQPDANAFQTAPSPSEYSQGALARNTPAASVPAREVPSNPMYGNPVANKSFPTTNFPTTPAVIDQAPPAANIEGFGKPGEKKLEGAQTPSVTIEKIAPPEIQVGKPAKFQVIVRNTGPVTAEEVEVTDRVPQGTQLINQPPKTTLSNRGEILWKVGDLKPSEESKLELDLMPISEGEIGSVATVQFRSTASVRTVATKPDLLMELTAPKQVMIGESATVHLKLTNRGTGVASGVVLSSKVPPQFQHPAGNELEFEIGQLKPGDVRDIELVLRSVQAGGTVITLTAQGDATNLRAEQSASIEVVAPGLKVQLTGPRERYLEKQAKYTVTVGNPGTASAKNLQLVTRLPKGMQFVEASDSGYFDAASNSVMWGLDELPPGENAPVTLTVLAKEAGEEKLRSEVHAAGNLSDSAEQVTMVEGVAAVSFTVVDVEDPVEVGGQATYEIHVVNQGSKAANGLRVMAVLPQEIKPVSGEGPSKQAINGQQVLFEPLARLAPKADVTYRVVGQCLAPGDCRVQVLLKTDEMEKPVTKEESTRVYKD